ncbi:MAG: hypothetical protein ACREXR_11935, partial [Gammaproteobacteria bacterium]
PSPPSTRASVKEQLLRSDISELRYYIEKVGLWLLWANVKPDCKRKKDLLAGVSGGRPSPRKGE